MRTLWSSILIVVLLFIISGVAFADVPRLITFQGKLTDEAGVPFADGSYDISFYISTDSLAGDLLWDETQSVEVSTGLFNVQLGLGSHLADSIFDRYTNLFLSMQVAGTPDELSPRTRLTSNAFAFRARTADVAISGGGWIDDGAVVHLGNAADNVGIGTATPSERLVVGEDIADFLGEFIVVGNTAGGSLSGLVAGEDVNNYGWLAWDNANGCLDIMTTAGGLPYYNSLRIKDGKVGVNTDWPIATLDIRGHAHATDSLTVGLTGQPAGLIYRDDDGSGGDLIIKRSNTQDGFVVDGNFGGSNQPVVAVLGDSWTVHFDMDANTGDLSVVLPESAINSDEMRDEPGVGNSADSDMSLELDGTWKTIRSRQCSYPNSGYVLAIGTCEILITHLSGTSSYVDFGFSGTPGDSATFVYSKRVSNLLPTAGYGEIITVQRFFAVGFETRTIFFQGKSTSADCLVKKAELTLLYFPTAYGNISPTALAPGETHESTSLTGTTMEDMIEQQVQMRTDAMKTGFDMETQALREENRRLAKRLEAIEAMINK